MVTTNQLLIIILVIALVTVFVRAIPFLVFHDNEKTPKFVVYLGNVLPYAMIGMLVIYCMKSISFAEIPYGAAEFTAIIFVVIMQLWKRNTLMSIGGGTILYMILVQYIFVNV